VCLCFVISLSLGTESSPFRIEARRRRFSLSRRRSSTYRRHSLSLSPHLLTESSVSVALPRRWFSYSRRGSSTYRRYFLSPHLLTESSVYVARVTMRFSLSRCGSTGIGREMYCCVFQSCMFRLDFFLVWSRVLFVCRFNSVLRWLSSMADGALCLSVALLDGWRSYLSGGGCPRRLTELSVDGSLRIAEVKLLFHVLQSYMS